MTVQSMGRYASRGTMMGVRAGYREVRTGAGRAKMMEYKVNNGDNCHDDNVQKTHKMADLHSISCTI